MSEEEKKEEKTENTESPVVTDNVTLVIAERDHLLDVVKERDELIESLTKQLADAVALIERDTRAQLINKIAPKTTVPKEVLAVMDINKLKEMEKTLATAKFPTIKAGTPLKIEKDSPDAKLANMYEDFKAKTWGKS